MWRWWSFLHSFAGGRGRGHYICPVVLGLCWVLLPLMSQGTGWGRSCRNTNCSSFSLVGVTGAVITDLVVEVIFLVVVCFFGETIMNHGVQQKAACLTLVVTRQEGLRRRITKLFQQCIIILKYLLLMLLVILYGRPKLLCIVLFSSRKGGGSSVGALLIGNWHPVFEREFIFTNDYPSTGSIAPQQEAAIAQGIATVALCLLLLLVAYFVVLLRNRMRP
mmetsp:Transcript_107954/g.247535  ORF Transcript_107954/g.247535 Transcript_107954/m.247535 type:complete len:220 (-) Transcript_107954:984-1643(-)